MKRFVLVLGSMLSGLGGLAPSASAQDVFEEKPATCEPGFQYVQETEYREVEHPVCKVVPNKRTKWVYSCKPDYFCVPGCPLLKLFHKEPCDSCDACKSCKGPYHRQLLLKKRVEYDCGTKCVVEMVKEKVPHVVWRKKPCLPTGPAPAPLVPPAATGPTGPPASTEPR